MGEKFLTRENSTQSARFPNSLDSDLHQDQVKVKRSINFEFQICDLVLIIPKSKIRNPKSKIGTVKALTLFLLTFTLRLRSSKSVGRQTHDITGIEANIT